MDVHGRVRGLLQGEGLLGRGVAGGVQDGVVSGGEQAALLDAAEVGEDGGGGGAVGGGDEEVVGLDVAVDAHGGEVCGAAVQADDGGAGAGEDHEPPPEVGGLRGLHPAPEGLLEPGQDQEDAPVGRLAVVEQGDDPAACAGVLGGDGAQGVALACEPAGVGGAPGELDGAAGLGGVVLPVGGIDERLPAAPQHAEVQPVDALLPAQALA